MKLFWSPQTRASRAIWLLEEAGVEYEVETIDIRAPDRKDSEEFRAASPMGKVPALVDGDVALADSAALCLYVADRYAPGILAPVIDDPARGKYLFWTLYAPSVIEPAMGEKVSGAKPNPASHAWGSFDLMVKTLEDGLGDNEWILGDQFTAADVMLGSSVVFMRMFGMLPESKVLSGYGDRCLARPGYAEAMAREAG